jgi:membrane-associated protease RseP (regulator of RpoE activity)
MAGGTFTNLVLGFLCFLIAFGAIGSPQVIDVPVIGTVIENSPAAYSGLVAGDKIISVNNVTVHSWQDLQQAVGTAKKPIHIVLEREGILTHPLEYDVENPNVVDGMNRIGITPNTKTTRLGLGDVFALTGRAVTLTAKAIVSIPVSLVKTAGSIFTGSARSDGLVSIIGVGQIAVAQEKATEDFSQKVAGFLSILGSLNIGLFVLNLIPLLPLDGGHSVNALYEGAKRGWAFIRRKPRPGPADLARSMPLAYFVYGLLILMAAILMIADIFNPVVG